MSRAIKQGIDYAGWSVNIFDGDRKIDKLIDAHGWKGFGVYFFLCMRAYGTNGYYYDWGYDDCSTTARKMGGGVTSATVEEAARFCLRVGLFDKGLFDRWGILTSKGIQRRFWDIAARGRQTMPVDKRYWLLAPEDAEGLAKVAHMDLNSHFFDDESSKNTDKQDVFETEVHKGKERKGKEIKTVSNDTVCAAAAPLSDTQRVVDAWNTLNLTKITRLIPGKQRHEMLNARIREYGVGEVLRAIENVRTSDFLNGKSKNGWTIKFDWFIRPNNFPKVLDGNYNSGGANGEKEYF